MYYKAMKQATTIIKMFGGPTALASAMNVTPQVVDNWRKRGIPLTRATAVIKAAAKIGRTLELKDFHR
jgi:hypothetical protein